MTVVRAALMVVMLMGSAFANAAQVSGTIASVFVGEDHWYGVRFYLNVLSDQTNGECNPEFVYSEPDAGSGHKEKVAVFLAAYLAGKDVAMTVASGRGGYCRLVEGAMR